MKSGKILLIATMAAALSATPEANAGWGWFHGSAGGGSGGWGSGGSGGWGSGGSGGWGSGGGGGWGSGGGGGWGSGGGGGWGSGGGGGRRVGPIRRLLGRMHARHSGGSGGWGSGGSGGGSYASSWGSGGSGGWGSGGGYSSYASYTPVTYAAPMTYAATSYASVGSSVSYAPAYESSPVYASAPIVESAPIAESYDSYQSYESPVYETAPVVTDDCCSGVVDEGYIEGSIDTYDSTSYDSYDSSSDVIETSSDVQPDGDAQMSESALIVVNVPNDARVYVNGYQTTSDGIVRQFLSSGLKSGKSYAYEVRAVVEKDGREIGETKVVRLSAGKRRELTFGALAQKNEETVLTIRVPKEAVVELAGVKTKMSGANRIFATTKLKNGDTWSDYQVKVTANGVTKEHTMTIRGGENHDLVFDFNDSQLALR